jgi:hypothetical protein
VLELLAAADPPSLLALAILALAGGLYPVGLFFGQCGCCECKFRVQILPAGFSGGVVNDFSHPFFVDLFVRSLSLEIDGGRPEASPDPITISPGLTLISDEDYVELQFEQTAGHVLRMIFEGTNTLLDSDDPVTLTVDEDSLDDGAWPEDPLGRDYLTRTSPTWEVRIVKPAGPCRCRECYCEQDPPPAELAEAPAAYTLQFVEGFYDEESDLYGPELPAPWDGLAPGFGDCPIARDRWAEPFSLKKMTAGELAELGLDELAGELVYMSEAIAWGDCTSSYYSLFPCSDGFARLCSGSLSLTGCVHAAAATRPGWKFTDYQTTPTGYTDDLFGTAFDFGIATATASESHTPDPAADCGVNKDGVAISHWCGGDCPKTEITVTVTLGQGKTAPVGGANADNPSGLGGSYTLDLVPEMSECGVLFYRYEEERVLPCSGEAPLRPTLGLQVTIAAEGCDCGKGNMTWGIAGLTDGGKDYWEFGLGGSSDVYPCVDACEGFAENFPGGAGGNLRINVNPIGSGFNNAPGCSGSSTVYFPNATIEFSA